VLAQQRQARIVARVRSDGAVRVADLVVDLGVSDMTIRRDLEVLAGRGLLSKVHGGATMAPGSTDEPGFAAKTDRQRAEKIAIATRAATMVRPGSAIGLSADQISSLRLGIAKASASHLGKKDVASLKKVVPSLEQAAAAKTGADADRLKGLAEILKAPVM